VACALQALAIHPLATFKFWLTTSKSVENTEQEVNSSNVEQTQEKIESFEI